MVGPTVSLLGLLLPLSPDVDVDVVAGVQGLWRQEEQEQEDQLEAHDEQQLQHTKEIIIVPPVNVMREKRKEEGKRE